MALTKTTVAVNNITALSDTPNATEGLTAAQLKAKFDKTGSDLKTYINDILTAEIDTSVAIIESGWTAVPATLTYASATTINTSVDLTSYIGVGDKLKLTQTSVKYFYVTAITNSLITVTGGSDYTVESKTITSPSYSHQESPIGFPQWFNYVPSLTNITVGTGSTLIAKFCLQGKKCTMSVYLKLGTGGSFGEGEATIGLPITSSDLDFIGSAYALDSGTAHFGGISVNSATTYLSCYNTASTASGWRSVVPFTWTVNDVLKVTHTYEIA
jgi:hypothetical protein